QWRLRAERGAGGTRREDQQPPPAEFGRVPSTAGSPRSAHGGAVFQKGEAGEAADRAVSCRRRRESRRCVALGESRSMPETTADVLIIGAGACGAALAWSLSETRMNVVCLEQGDRVNPAELPGMTTAWEVHQVGDF